MKTDYKPGDKVVVIKFAGPLIDIGRGVGQILTVKYTQNERKDIWQVFFEESLGLDFEHIRPLTLLEKELLE